MELTPHVLLVGDGAERFAKLLGFTKTNLLTQESKAKYEDWTQGKGQFYPTRYTKLSESLFEWYKKYVGSVKSSGTVNIIALDEGGNLAVGVSTQWTIHEAPRQGGRFSHLWGWKLCRQ